MVAQEWLVLNCNALLVMLSAGFLLSGCGGGQESRSDLSLSPDQSQAIPAEAVNGDAEKGIHEHLRGIPFGVDGAALADMESLSDPDPALLAELASILERELSAAGKNISSTETKAPTGEGNVLIENWPLRQYLRNEPNSETYMARLSFLECLLGDYDLNGEVNAGDLVQIARNFGRSVSYSGKTSSDGSRPIADDFGLGLIDGNADGIINVSDITLIAQHWKESSEGIRIYMKNGSTPEILLPDHGNAQSALTISMQETSPD